MTLSSNESVLINGLACSMAMGADWCNSAQALTFAVGCTQSQRCHTNHCPSGVTTQSKLQRALNVPDKAEQVHNYHRNTVQARRDDRRDGARPHQRGCSPTTSCVG